MREIEEQQTEEHESSGSDSGSEEGNTPRRIPDGYMLAAPQQDQDFWTNVVFQIVILQMLGGIFVLTTFYLSGDGLGFPFEITSLILWLLASVVFSGILSFAISSMLAVSAAYMAHVVCGMLKVDAENISVGTMVGGIVGLAMTLPWWPWHEEHSSNKLLLMIMATTLGQYGGARGARRWLARQKLSRRSAERFTKKQLRPFQFSIRQLLVVTTCSAVLLTLLKWAGMLSTSFILFLGTWLVLQVVGLFLAKLASNSMHQSLSNAQSSRGPRDA